MAETAMSVGGPDAVSRRLGGDAALAEDLVQDTWMRALADWPAHGLPREPLAWLIRVARNTLIYCSFCNAPHRLPRESSGLHLAPAAPAGTMLSSSSS